MEYVLVVSIITADRFIAIIIQNGKIAGINYHIFYSSD
jgi:hypothetical protein